MQKRKASRATRDLGKWQSTAEGRRKIAEFRALLRSAFTFTAREVGLQTARALFNDAVRLRSRGKRVLRDQNATALERMDAAKAAAPYVHARNRCARHRAADRKGASWTSNAIPFLAFH